MDALHEPVRMSVAVPAHPESLPRLRVVVTELLERSHWPEDRLGDVLLAVSEALGNAIEHGSRPGASIDVDIAVTPEAARIRVADRGRPGARPPDGAPLPPPPDSARGRGRLIMDALADRWETAPAGDGTEVVLHFSSTSRADGVDPRWDIALSEPSDARP